jgi:hypothetical protein
MFRYSAALCGPPAAIVKTGRSGLAAGARYPGCPRDRRHERHVDRVRTEQGHIRSKLTEISVKAADDIVLAPQQKAADQPFPPARPEPENA